MAVVRQLNQLRKGAIEWNAWREQNREVHIDLSKADLSKVDLSEVDLEEAILIEASLMRANLERANLKRANLEKANLIEAGLMVANLKRANLERANLIGANLMGANLIEANLMGAELVGANLMGADLTGANLMGADLTGANLSLFSASMFGTGPFSVFKSYRATDLSRANLSRANLSRANLNETNLNETNLSQAIVEGTIFGSLDLRTVKGLETIEHQGPSEVSISTLERSNGDISDLFLKSVGLSDAFITYIRSLVQSPIRYYTCFLSYSSKDELFAKRLHNDLQQKGVQCWFAPEDLDIGDKIKSRIDESIHLYDKLLLVLSEHSIKSSWVAYEVERALKKEPKGTPNVLYPIRTDKAILTCRKQWAKDIKETRNIGNFECWTDSEQYQESFNRLLRALNTEKEQRKTT